MQRTVLVALAGLLALSAPALAVVSSQDQVDMLHALVAGTAQAASGAGAGNVDPGPFPALPIAYEDDSGNVWQESNGVPGLQEQPVMHDGQQVAPADSFVAGFASLGAL
jgi:hypothetical protein